MTRTEINVAEPAPTQLYSDAIVAGGLVFTTGQMPLAADGSVVSPDLDTQARAVFTQLASLLESAGSSVADIVKLTIYLADIDDVARLAPLRADFLGATRPASVIVQTGRFGTPGMLLEAEAVAVVRA